MAYKQGSSAGKILLVGSVVIVGFGVFYALSNLQIISLPSFLAGGFGSSVKNTLNDGSGFESMPNSFFDFMDHVDKGISAANIIIGGDIYPLSPKPARQLIQEVFAMDPELSVGQLAENLPLDVIKMQPSAVFCSLEFKSARSKDAFQILIYRGENNHPLAAFKRAESAGRVIILDGQYGALALWGRINKITGDKCI